MGPPNEGPFLKQTFGVKKDPIKHFLEKLHFMGQNKNLGPVGF